MSQTSNIISPCSRLNGDVLREIYIHCIIHAGDPYTDYYSKNISTCFKVYGRYQPSIREHPQLSVSKVCSSWRGIALLTPQLWDNISIEDLTEANLSIAREYLSRAKNQPVSITIVRLTAWFWEYVCPQLTDFLSSYRIRTLALTAPPDMMARFHLVLFDLPQRSVAELESLTISTARDQEEAHIDFNDTRYPKLAYVRIWGAYKISSFNSSSLRKFNGMSISMTVIEGWDLLSRCPSLEESLLRITGLRLPPVSMPQIHLQRLCVLALDSESEILFNIFIEVLTLPVVEALHVVHGWSATAFQSLAHRSNYFPHLRDFYLKTSVTTTIDAGALLATMPRLTSIYFPDSSTIFDHLALNSLSSGSLAPRLQTISVGCTSNTDAFLDMVESRIENAQMSSNGVPARFTRVVYRPFFQDYSDRQRLRDMWQRGIPINVP